MKIQKLLIIFAILSLMLSGCSSNNKSTSESKSNIKISYPLVGEQTIKEIDVKVYKHIDLKNNKEIYIMDGYKSGAIAISSYIKENEKLTPIDSFLEVQAHINGSNYETIVCRDKQNGRLVYITDLFESGGISVVEK